MRLGVGLWLFAAAFGATTVGQASLATWRVDPATSHVTIHVGKAGVFSFVAGHTHEVTGPIEAGAVEFDSDDPARSQVQLSIATAALEVSPIGEPSGDAPKVQETMAGPKVLDVATYPHITFDSTSASVDRRDGPTLDLRLSGRLTIRNVTQPVTALVHVQLTDSGLTADGTFTIKQTAFGISPVSVAGVVAVKDALDIAFSIVASR